MVVKKEPPDSQGTPVYQVPLPRDLKQLKEMSPLVITQHYEIDYIHSYAQDSPFFAGLTNGKLLGTRCAECGYAYATPRRHCMECGSECDWIELPTEGTIHTFTVCHYGSEEFLPEVPFILGLIEFDGIDTLFLARLAGFDPDKPSLDWIGMRVKAKFRRFPRLKPTDVTFVPVE